MAVAAEVAGDVLIGGQRAAKVQRALDGRIAVSLVGGVQRGVQLGSGLIHGLVGFDQGRLVGLDFGIRCGNIGVGLGDILGKLIRLAVQRGLLGLQIGLRGLQVRLGLLQLGALLLQLGVLIFKLLAGVLVLINDLIQCGGKGQQLV